MFLVSVSFMRSTVLPVNIVVNFNFGLFESNEMTHEQIF